MSSATRPPIAALDRRAFSALLLLAPFGLAACGRGGSDAQTSATLRIGDQARSLELPIELAGQAGNTPRPLSFTTFTDGPNMNAAFLAKALDIGTMGDTPALFASAAGADVVVVAAGHARPNGLLQIVARPGTGIRSLGDLRGKSVAATRGTALHGYLLLALHRAGLKQGDIRLIDVPLVALGRTLQSGDADAAVLAGPQIVSYLAQEKGAVPLDAPDGVYNVILAARRALADAPTRAALRDFVQRGTRAGRWVEAHPQIWRERYYQGLQHQDAAIAQAMMARQRGYIRYFQPVDDTLRAHLERQAQLLAGAGVLPNTPETVARLFDPAVTREFNQVIKEASS